MTALYAINFQFSILNKKLHLFSELYYISFISVAKQLISISHKLNPAVIQNYKASKLS